jgi:outer membrane protein assembly complex protein YaeT
VLDVRLSCDAQLSLADFPGAVSQEAGQPLESSKIAASLKKLYATGRFAELRAEAEPGQGGVHLLFVGRAQYFVGVVQVEGTPSTLEPRILLTSTRLRLGEPVSENILVAAQKHISEILASNSYYRASVRYRLLHDAVTQEAEAIFSVVPGRPARLSSVEFQGHPGFPSPKLAKAAGWRSGIQLTSARLERGLLKLHQFYVSRSHLQATATVLKREYDPALNAEKLLVRVEGGPLIAVRVQGAKISRSKLKTLLPVYRDGVVDDPSLARSEGILEDYFQQQGYFSVSVKAQHEFHAESNKVDLTFHVNRGKPGQFVGYGFEGNRTIPAKQLMAAISSPAQGFFGRGPHYSRTLVENDVNTLTELYRSRGFLDAKISPLVEDHFGDQPGHRFVTFKVEEGFKTTVHRLALNGISGNIENALWPSLLSKPTQPYSPGRAASDRDAISNYLADRGYAQAEVSWHATPVKGQHQVDLDFRIEPGMQERIQRIFVLGNDHARLAVIRRELVIHRGEPLGHDSIAESQSRLYGVGIFSQVQIATQNAGEAETQNTVLVSVEEARRWTLGYGGGLEVQRLGSNNPQGTFKASPRLSLNLSRLDVGGRAQTFNLWGRLSYIETGAGTNYVFPYLFNRRDLSLRLSGLVDRSRDVLTFTDDQRGASITVEKRFSASTAVSARYSFSRVEALDISNRISPEEVPLLSRPARVGGFGGSYINDRRDDPLDATRGFYALADAGVMYKNFGSEANFLRFTGQYATYYQLNSHLVFARNTRFGLESPYGSLERISIGPNQYIYTDSLPLPERLFMGGSDSHRGFAVNQAGPRDPETGYPIGGNALFFNTVELRLRLEQQRLGIVFFNDSGNVFTTIRHMRLLKFNQNSPTDLDYDSDALGVGLRYKTPVGPLSFDVGYNLNPPRYPVATPTGTEVQRLSRFQFFLSVGQSF